MKKTVIAFVLLAPMLLAGCGAMKKAWKIGSVPQNQLATIETTVFNKPCQLKHRQSECPLPTEGGYCEDRRHRANATFYGANTVVNEDGVMDYFYCAPGIPLFKGPYSNAWLIRHDNSIQNATMADYDKAVEQCDYEAHKATVNTSPSTPQRAFLPTGSYALNKYQLDTIHQEKMQKLYDEIHLDSERIDLKQQCIKTKGYIVTRSSSQADFDDLKRHCPDIDNLVEPCFITDATK